MSSVQDDPKKQGDERWSDARLVLITLPCVLFPDALILACFTSAFAGQLIFGAVADKTADTMGLMIFFAALFWLWLLFIVDVQLMPRLLGALCCCLGIGMFLTAAFLKAVAYPWVPALLALSLGVVVIGVLRKTLCTGKRVDGSRFYQAVAVSFAICGCISLVIWVAWIVASGRTWGSATREFLAAENAKVYEYLSKDVALDYASRCRASSRDLSEFSTKAQQTILKACAKAENVWFLQWAGPFILFGVNSVAAGFCMLFSRTSKEESKGDIDIVNGIVNGDLVNCMEEHAKMQEHFRKILKRFVLVISLSCSLMYCSLYVSGAAVRLGSAILCLAFAATAALLGWMFLEVQPVTMYTFVEDLPLAGLIIGALMSDWARAMFFGAGNIAFPLMALSDILRQRVRRLRGTAESKGRFTEAGGRLVGRLSTWNWCSIFSKVNIISKLFVLLIVGMKVTFVVFSALNAMLAATLWNFYVIALLVFIIGVIMFMCPIVPGSAVYLFAGVVLGYLGEELESGPGFWAAVAVASVAGSIAKHLACFGQYSLGYFMGKAVKVQQFVGVDKVGTRAMEYILSKPGFDLGKVCILVAGPDFPTSVLCGILRLRVFSVLLGTTPVILVSIIPQTVVGALLVKPGDDASFWAMISTGATGAAAAVQAGAMLIFMYRIMQTVQDRKDELMVDRPEHEAVGKLTEAEAAYVRARADATKWDVLSGSQQMLITSAVALLLLSCFAIAADFMYSEKFIFRSFKITGDIMADYEVGGLKESAWNLVIMPTGWVALGLAFLGCLADWAFGRMADSAARQRLPQVTPES